MSAPRSDSASLPLPRLWFGVFGAPAAWAVQLIVDYAVVAHACYPATVPLSHPVISGARPIAIAATLVCLGVAVCALWLAAGSTRTTIGNDAIAGARPGRIRFMARAGLIVSILFTFAILMAFLPLLTRPACT